MKTGIVGKTCRGVACCASTINRMYKQQNNKNI